MKIIRPFSDNEKSTLRRTSNDVRKMQIRIYSGSENYETLLFELFVESLQDLPKAIEEKLKEEQVPQDVPCTIC